MKVITIGSDRSIFEEGSPAQVRILAYAKAMEELHIVVFALSGARGGHSYFPMQIGNVYMYPTQSSSRSWYISDAYRIGKRVIREHAFIRGASVISTQDPFEAGLVGYMLRKKFRLPLQMQIHTDFLNGYFNTTFLNRIRSVLARFLVPRAQGLRVVSSRIAQSLASRFGGRIVTPDILPIFVDISAIENAPVHTDLRKLFPQFNFIIVMASRLTQEKDIPTALYALQHIYRKFPRVGLVIAGSGSEERHLRNLATSLGLADNVVFLGWQDDVFSLFKTAHVFLSTSLYEGYGMTLVEAFACGCLVVTTDVGIANTLCKNDVNAFVCPVGGDECIARALTTLISDNIKRELFKQQMSYSIKEFSPSREAYVAQYVALLQKLVMKI